MIGDRMLCLRNAVLRAKVLRWCCLALVLFSAVVMGALGSGCGRGEPETPEATATLAVTATPVPTERPTETPSPTPEPTLTPTPQVVQSEGEVTVPVTNGFDLDAGENPGEMRPGLDFILSSPSTGTLEFFPAGGAMFAFSGASPEQPDQEQCANSPYLTHNKHVITELKSRYVCYQTSEGRPGYLHFTALGDARLSFTWLTFVSPQPEFPPLSGARTYYAFAQDTFVPYDRKFDVDQGVEVESEDPAGDFVIADIGETYTVTLTPVDPAKFAFGQMYQQEPSLHDCMNLDASVMHSKRETIAPLAVDNVCYRTREGRYGFLHFTEVTTAGVTFDWKTFEVASAQAPPPLPGAVEEPTQAVTPPPTCQGGELWLDVWPVAISCEAGSEAWTATIFVEGHGGDCVYTYAWQDEVQGGPMTGSMTFDVYSGGGKIIGTASVTSGGVTVTGPVYVERKCP